MNNTQKIIIAALIGIIIVLGAAVAGSLMKEPVKTVELFENGTTIQVPENTALKSHDGFSTTYITGKNTTVIGVDNSNLIGALASRMLSDIVVEKGERQDSGLYKLDKNSIIEIADQLGMEYDEKNIKDAVVGIKHNNTVNQSVIIIGADEKEISDILKSIDWKEGKHKNTTSASMSQQEAPSTDNNPTYPFISDDGSIVGYYHPGDVVEHCDGLYQLKSNGEWEYIGEAKGSSEAAYHQGYSDGMEDSYDYEVEEYPYYEDSNIETTSDSSDSEITTDYQ